MKQLAIIDNYDSFTYNLVHLFRQITGSQVAVFRNDKITPEMLADFTHIALSPGPGLPDEAGSLKEIIKRFAGEKIMLGICLGHQAIGEVFGSDLTQLKQVYHGKQSEVHLLSTDGIFKNIPQKIMVGRYHSWVIDPKTLSPELETIAQCEDGTIMGIKHKSYPIYGLQFHPESILTKYGHHIIENWINLEEV
ncbi:MAG: aminodeoxychorismate/anthranilate synthase component II [Calditrichia bacterium]